RGGEVEVHCGDVGPGQVVDHDRVDPAEGVEGDRLDVIGVDRDVAHVAEELGVPIGQGRDVDLLVGGRAVEEERVVARLALDGVAAVARVPDEGIVAGAELGCVVAGATNYRVLALAAGEVIDPRAADEGQPDQVGGQVRGVQRVVAPLR